MHPAASQDIGDAVIASQRPGSAVCLYGDDSHPPFCRRRMSDGAFHFSTYICDLLWLSFVTDDFLREFSTNFMQHSKHAPECIASGSAFMVESSAKGIRTCILNHDRCSASSDEIVNTFPTPFGDQKQSGVHAHLLCRSKLNSYIHKASETMSSRQTAQYT